MFTELFANHMDHLIGWILFSLLFALLGWLLEYFTRGRHVKGLRAQVADWEKKYKSLFDEHETLKKKYADLEAELAQARKDLEDRDKRIRTLENEKGQLYGDLQLSKTELETNLNLVTGLTEERDSKATEILGLMSQLKATEGNTAEISSLKAKLKATEGHAAEIADLRAKLKATEGQKAEIADLKAKLQAAGSGNDTEIADLRAKLKDTSTKLGTTDKELHNTKIALQQCKDSKENSPTGNTGGSTGTTGGNDTGKPDLLQAIEGIGPKMEEALNKGGVKTFKTLGNSKKGDLDKVVERAGYNPGISDTQSWIDQASLASSGKWQDLHDMQLDEGGGAIAKIDKYETKLGIKLDHSNHEGGANDTGKPDLLQAIEGIGPKMEEALNKGGVKTFKTLGGAKKGDLDALIEKAGYNPGISDTQSWIDQARLASSGKWQDLHDMQLDEGGGSIAKIDKYQSKLGIKLKHEENATPDMLQIIEGVGPKMEEALNKGGIKSFLKLGQETPDSLNSVIEKAGYNSGISDTESWIKQARMAATGKWQQLHDYQLDDGGGAIAKIDKFESKLGIKLVHKERGDKQPDAPAKDEPKLSKAEKEAQASAAADKVRAKMNTLPKATAADKDDLKKISGIGPFIENKLNDLGIYTFEQVSKFDDDMKDTVNVAIQFFPGRIKRDDWTGQALALFKSK